MASNACVYTNLTNREISDGGNLPVQSVKKLQNHPRFLYNRRNGGVTYGAKALNNRMVDPGVIYIDGTHIKASANKKKLRQRNKYRTL